MKDLMKKMEESFSSDVSDDEVIRVQKEIQALKDEKADKSFSTLLKIRKVLTLDQRKEFMELLSKSKRKKNRRGRMSRGRRGNGPKGEMGMRPPLEAMEEADHQH